MDSDQKVALHTFQMDSMWKVKAISVAARSISYWDFPALVDDIIMIACNCL